MREIFYITKLSDGWDWRDFEMGISEFDYCISELEIPEEYIDYTEADSSRRELEIGLVGFEEECEEDWFIQLVRLSSDSESAA